MATGTKQIEAGRVEKEVLDIVRDVLVELGRHQSAAEVSLHSSFERDLGIGSLDLVEVLVRCEARFELKLPDSTAEQADTPAEWVRAILRGGQAASTTSGYRILPAPRDAPPAPDAATTMVDVLRAHAEMDPERVHIHLLEDDDSGQGITYGQLWETASGVAAGLVASGLKRGETVAIMLPTCADFFYAYFGIMLAGGTAVPIYPPTRPDRIEEYVRRQVLILRNAGIRFLISFDQVKAVSQLMRHNLPGLIDVSTVAALREARAKLAAGSIEPCETAFIQYTSGSTGDPKGVVLSHSNLLANIRGIGGAVEVRRGDAVVSWLPLYSDMGLIGSWLFSLYFATPITMLSPLAILSRPERWLWAIHDSRGTLCAAPNFAYEICARKIPTWTLEGLDLSSWRVAINAGEAVLPETVARFTERFQPFGFRRESFLPCYGLAECSVALSIPPINRLPVIDTIRRESLESLGKAEPVEQSSSPAVQIFSVGRPLPGHEVRIVDDQNREVGERMQGRLLFRGPSRTSGYYRNPEATAAVLTEDGWMDSGDLAYWAGGELYVTARRKDCIIRSGRNISPHDVETAAAEVPGVQRGAVAAFGVVDRETGTERLVVVAETRATKQADMARIEAGIIRSVDDLLGIPPDKIQLISYGSIPKTSNGKIRRNQARSLYLAGKLDAVRRPPWLQIILLWIDNVRPWLKRRFEQTGKWLWDISLSAARVATASLAGLAIRLLPRKGNAWWILRPAARCLLRLNGQDIEVQRGDVMEPNRPAVFVANRSGRLDPLALLAALPKPVCFADTGVLAGLSAAESFFLRPLIIDPVNGEMSPPGGTIHQRIRQALNQQYSVLVLPESAIGAPPQLSRFRLDAFHACIEGSVSVYPVGVRMASPIIEVIIGDRMEPAEQVQAAALREQVRGVLTLLCQ